MFIILVLCYCVYATLFSSLDIRSSKYYVRKIQDTEISLDVIMYKFGDNDIRDAIIDILNDRVTVRMIVDKSENDKKGSDAEKCADAGAQVRYWNLKNYETLHGKMVIFDGKECSIGSPNFSNDASDNNLEIWAVFNDCDEFTDLFEKIWHLSA
jgi:phosphatidylserine/phosphatidylglycerophosphate/cardiolipin synthase-like enzyme